MSATRPEALVGRTIGENRLVQHVASGGLGHVFVASHPSRKAQFALKLLRPELENRALHLGRFDREAKAGSRIHHPNVLDVHGEAKTDGAFRFFTMELLRGLDLADTLQRQRTLAPSRAVRVARAIARGLDAAHAVGVVHRDLKPENVFLVHASDGREIPKVIDFGAAWVDGDSETAPLQRITIRSSLAVGTPEYMPPEQLERVAGHPNADVYALGILLVELLTGRVPFQGSTWQEVVHLHATRPVPRVPNVSGPLADVIEQMVRKRPEDRFVCMSAVDVALGGVPEAERNADRETPA